MDGTGTSTLSREDAGEGIGESRKAIQVVSPEGTFVSPVSFVAVKIRLLELVAAGSVSSGVGEAGERTGGEAGEAKEVERWTNSRP